METLGYFTPVLMKFQIKSIKAMLALIFYNTFLFILLVGGILCIRKSMMMENDPDYVRCKCQEVNITLSTFLLECVDKLDADNVTIKHFIAQMQFMEEGECTDTCFISLNRTIFDDNEDISGITVEPGDVKNRSKYPGIDTVVIYRNSGLFLVVSFVICTLGMLFFFAFVFWRKRGGNQIHKKTGRLLREDVDESDEDAMDIELHSNSDDN